MKVMHRNEVSNEQLDLCIKENMGLIVLLAKSFCPKDDDQLEEFIQLGRIAVWKALRSYDPSRASLSTIIWNYIRWEIIRHINKDAKFKHSQLDDTIPIEYISSKNDIWEIIPDNLTNKEKDVIKLRLEGNSFLSIGKNMGYSKCWANNVFKKAVGKIQNAQ